MFVQDSNLISFMYLQKKTCPSSFLLTSVLFILPRGTKLEYFTTLIYCLVTHIYIYMRELSGNKKCVNFLDITFDLRSGTFKPYMKPGNVPQYVNVQSNYPPSILRRIPQTINQRLSGISSDKQSFDASTRPYQEALKKSGYSYNLHYDPEPAQKTRRRSRNILPGTTLLSPQTSKPTSDINSLKQLMNPFQKTTS